MNDKNTTKPEDMLPSYGVEELSERYGIGINRSYQLIHEISYINGGLVLSRNRILWSELLFFEEHRGRHPDSNHPPNEKEIKDWDELHQNVSDNNDSINTNEK